MNSVIRCARVCAVPHCRRSALAPQLASGLLSPVERVPLQQLQSTLLLRDTMAPRVPLQLCVCVCVRAHVCACIFGQGGVSPFLPGLRLSLYGHTGVLGSVRSPLVRPTVQARGASLCCPSTSAIRTFGQNLARCPRTTLEVGWWLRGFRRASSTVLVQRDRHACIFGQRTSVSTYKNVRNVICLRSGS